MNADPASAFVPLAILLFGTGWVLARLGVLRGFWPGFWAGLFTRVFVGSLRRRRGGILGSALGVFVSLLVVLVAVRACTATGG